MKHGDSIRINGSEVPEYLVWCSMKRRCYNQKGRDYKNYGGRGIKVCDRWLNNYPGFLEDVGRRPSPQHTLGRINNDGDYDPLNCQWETRLSQSRNRRGVLKLSEVREVRMLSERGYTQQELANEFGVTRSCIWSIVHNKNWKE
jgi:hypothetical protein